MMASIARRPDGSRRARYIDPTGRERSRHFKRKADGQRWLNEVTASMVTGQYIDPRASSITVEAYAHGWQSTLVGREGSQRIVDNALRLHILPRLGTRTMQSIRHSDVQQLVKGWSDGLAPGSVWNVYEQLARMMAAAVEDRVTATTPCRRIVLPRADDAEIIPPTVEEVFVLTEAMPLRYRAAVILLAGSGLRISELLALKATDLEFLRRCVRVERARRQDGSIGPTKSSKSTRSIPLGEVVLNVLSVHLAEYPTNEWVFCDAHGRPLSYRRWKHLWNDARRQTGLGGIKTHDLRHFFASALISGGASVKQVQSVLGHSNPMITLRIYARLWPGDEDRTRSVMDVALAAARTERGLNDHIDDETAGQQA